MTKIVVNNLYGSSFGLTKEMMDYIGYVPKCEWDGHEDISRTDPKLIEYLEKFGDDQLKIVEIPDDVDWEIESDECLEFVAEKHRVWFAS